MRTTMSLIVVTVLLAAGCATTVASEDVAATPSTTIASTTSKAIPVTSQPSPTTTTVAPADPEEGLNSPFRIEPNDTNPIIEKPTDQGGAMLPSVVVSDGVIHMWFTQTTDWMAVPTAIFHATSDDGLAWTVDPEPVLTGDGEGFDAFSVAEGTVVDMGDRWIMYYNARAVPGPGPGPSIGRAVAEGPGGPWVTDPEPVLTVGDPGSWDSGFVSPNTALATEDGIMLFYSGGTNYIELEPTATGLAMSVDSTQFTKSSEPVLSGSATWDERFSWEAAVFEYDGGYGAFYTGDPETLTGETIGYAWSADGVNWASATDNPLLKPRTQAWASLDVVAGSVIKTPDGRWLLFYSGNVNMLDFSIGVAELVPAD